MRAFHPLRRRLAVASGTILDRLYGRDGGAFLERLEGMERWGAERYRAYQDERLAALLDHCWRRVPAYRRRFEKAGLRPADLPAGRSALERLPPLSKGEVQSLGAELLDGGRPARGWHAAMTSGTSGSPVRVWHDPRFAGWSRAVERRAFRWFGVEAYAPRFFLLGTPLPPLKRLRHRLIDLATGRRLVGFHGLTPAAMRRLLGAIRRYRPAYIASYPGVLHDLCRFAVAEGISLRDAGVLLIQSQSEMLLDLHRESFREVFGEVPVLDVYGCVEVGSMAFSCPGGTFHVSHDQVLLEVVDDDGHAVPPGTEGRILLTALEARAMPLLRYEVGDLGTLGPGQCPCGRMPGLEILERLEGRTFEHILTADGKALSAGIVHFLVKKAGALEAVAEYLAVQRFPGELILVAVPGPRFEPAVERRLAEACRELFAGQLSLRLEQVQRIDRPPGKRGYFRSDIEKGGAP